MKTGQRKPAPWPVLERIKTTDNQPGQVRWHRTVLRPPPEVTIEKLGNVILLSGRAGSRKLDLRALDPTGLMAFKLLTVPAGVSGGSADGAGPSTRISVILASPDASRFSSVVQVLESAFQGVMQGYMVGMTVKGVGYRIEPIELTSADGTAVPRKTFFEKPTGEMPAITYPYSKPVTAVRLRVGYSRPVVFPLPSDVRGFCIKPTLFYLYGLDMERLQRLAQDIRAVRKPSVYTGNGIQLVGEVLRTKQRSSRKAK